MTMLIDTHVHLESDAFRGEEEAVVVRAAAAGVTRMVAIGCDLESSRAALALARRFPGVRATVGVHPTYVTEVTDGDWLEQLREMAQDPCCVGIGETGLDFYHAAPEGWSEAAYRDRQREFFGAQLGLAAGCGLNVVVHQRDRTGRASWEEIRAMVGPWEGLLRCVFHCWVHPWSEAAPMVAAGHLVGFGGVVTYPKAEDAARAAAGAPLGTFVLETDGPYLAPVPHRGKRNEPAYLRQTAEKVAFLRGMTLEALAEATSAVADGFFRPACGRSPGTTQS
jgi:TatD DNase family protein